MADFQKKVEPLPWELVKAEDDDWANELVNGIYELALHSPAEKLVRFLLSQALDATGMKKRTARSMQMTDPTTGARRTVEAEILFEQDAFLKTIRILAESTRTGFEKFKEGKMTERAFHKEFHI